MSNTNEETRASNKRPQTGLHFASGCGAGLLVAFFLSFPIGFVLIMRGGLAAHTMSSQEILDRINQVCESVPVKAHNLMFYDARKNAPECWGAFTMFPEDFGVYLAGLNSQRNRYASGDECSTFTPSRPPNELPVHPRNSSFWEPDAHWWLYKAVNTVTYCTKDHHLWLCCDTDNHRVFFYRNRN
jgi:hypothetical protein